MKAPGGAIQAVFFDLDGTLVDSAPDLIVAMRRLRAEQGEVEIDLDDVGKVVSKGGRAMLRRGFPGADEARVEALLPHFLDLYAESIATHSALFPGIDSVLESLEGLGLRWGIVTNKPDRLSRALLSALRLETRCAALVSGDSLAQRKPDPEPVLHACALAGVRAGQCVYVGDDLRDIQAGRRAGALAVAAGWGYLNGEDPLTWGADAVAATPRELLSLLELDGRTHVRRA